MRGIAATYDTREGFNMSESTAPLSPEAILTVRRLCKGFTLHALGGRVVESLRGISLTLHAGEHVALAGASGAGKSSLLRCLIRNYLPDDGRVVLHNAAGDVELTTLDDRSMARLRGRDVGYVSQFLNAGPRTSPMQHVLAAARRRLITGQRALDAAAEALSGLGIDQPLWDVDCSVLSGGERQRVNLAAGVVSPPRLLLLDEPVSALDPRNREKALVTIERLAEQGVSVLAVYHDMRVIQRVASRVIVLADGRVIDEGNPHTVLEKHHSAFEEAAA